MSWKQEQEFDQEVALSSSSVLRYHGNELLWFLPSLLDLIGWKVWTVIYNNKLYNQNVSYLKFIW